MLEPPLSFPGGNLSLLRVIVRDDVIATLKLTQNAGGKLMLSHDPHQPNQ